MPGHAVALENACKDVVFLVETQVVTKLVVVNGVEGAVSALPACVARLARSTDQSVSVDTGDGGAARASVVMMMPLFVLTETICWRLVRAGERGRRCRGSG